MKMDLTCDLTVEEAFRQDAVALYDEAFGSKFSVAIPSDAKRRRLLESCLDLRSCIGVVADGRLVGITGIQTNDGSLTGGISFKALIQSLGVIGGVWAAGVLSLYERKNKAGELLMDGIAVNASHRGLGIGGHMISAVKHYAQSNGYASIRLDVIDTNESAKRLYERSGFQSVKTESFPYLRWLLGFGGVTTMTFQVQA